MITDTEIIDPDLSRVITRVREKHPEWHEKRLQAAVEEYKKFLYLCKIHPGVKISAPLDVDEVWHVHILDTQNYDRDCNSYFGYFLHHDPCIGPLDRENARTTLDLYSTTFMHKPDELWSAAMTCANPGGGCGSLPR
jgi:hypothetical protein